MTAILDSGAPSSIVNWVAVRQAGVFIETKGVKRRAGGTGGLGAQVADTYLYKFKRIKARLLRRCQCPRFIGRRSDRNVDAQLRFSL